MQLFSGYYENYIGNVGKCSIIKSDLLGKLFIYSIYFSTTCAQRVCEREW